MEIDFSPGIFRILGIPKNEREVIGGYNCGDDGAGYRGNGQVWARGIVVCRELTFIPRDYARLEYYLNRVGVVRIGLRYRSLGDINPAA